MPVQDVQLLVENHLRNLIMKHFDPKKADTIFNLEGGAPAWLTEMIEHSIWRLMLYKLAELHPNCLMLNFTIKVNKYLLRWPIKGRSVTMLLFLQRCYYDRNCSSPFCSNKVDEPHELFGTERWRATHLKNKSRKLALLKLAWIF